MPRRGEEGAVVRINRIDRIGKGFNPKRFVDATRRARSASFLVLCESSPQNPILSILSILSILLILSNSLYGVRVFFCERKATSDATPTMADPALMYQSTEMPK